jgi:two-component system chemotaxis response regulator CheB
MNPNPIKVLVVDDSAVARKIISSSLEPFADITVVGTAIDPYMARDKIIELSPDVVTLDIEMPRMDGITFLKLIMKHRPMPVIVMSSLTATGSGKAIEALNAGAIDIMGKPGGSFTAHANGAILAEKIRAAATVKIHAAVESSPQPVKARSLAAGQGDSRRNAFPARRIILLGASTGGTEALKTVLTALPGDLPGICIVQHIPAYFSKAFADRLNTICAMEVREACHGDIVAPGLALVAPGGQHLVLKWRAHQYVVELNDGPQLHHQRPAVDVLFESAVKAGAAPYAAAALLTGMGADGAAGLLSLRQAGAATIAQNEETCVVYGMPREAVRLGAAQQVLPLNRIAPALERIGSENSEEKYEQTT